MTLPDPLADLTPPADNRRAILLMVCALFFFAAMDASAKALSREAGTVMALWARYAGQALLVFILVSPRLKSVAKTNFPGLQLARSALLMGATTCFFFGISHIGLAQATAIMDLNPVLITLGAAFFLGETVGPRRMFAIAAALVGALIIIRPGGAVFSLWSMLPLGTAVCYAGYTLITRYVGRSEDPWTSLLYAALFGALILSAIVPFHWVPLTAYTGGLMVLLAGFGTFGQLLLIRAFTSGEAAMLAPFGYVGLVFATIFGVVIFGDWPDFWTWIGASVVVASGIYVWHRERQIRPRD
ncbi:DMT family transporter [Pseudooceanicola sp.]|uniref:DMT family transporter n=1 Tax=Pseudooceanicola sp. TaxID=1914328 RepID=UPI00260F186A|nr:DMT family transporter [Pseudooceanicola sp.]MDF1854863.1 DMT family transporter [Pseudooceanicola sp.]